MNTRAIEKGMMFVPKKVRQAAAPEPAPLPEEMLFDKAEEAESLEKLRSAHVEIAQRYGELEKRIGELAESLERENAQKELSGLELRRKRLELIIADREAKAVGGD